MPDIDDRVLDSLSVAPDQGGPSASDPRQEAGQDESIAKRLERNPASQDAKLDAGLDESMDASDVPAALQPSTNEPAPSSGFDEEAERKLQQGN